MKKIYLSLILLCFIPFAFADIDTFEGTATSDLSDIEGQTVASGDSETCDYTDDFTGTENAMPSGWSAENSTSWAIKSNTLRGCNAHAFARFDTALSVITQYAIFEVNGVSTGTVGIVFRSSSDGTGNRYVIKFATSGGTVSWEVMTTAWVEDVDSDASALTITNGDFLAAEVVGTGNDTIVSYWHWDADPGDRSDWGTADGTLDANPTNACNAGLYTGLYSTGCNETHDNWCAGGNND